MKTHRESKLVEVAQFSSISNLDKKHKLSVNKDTGELWCTCNGFKFGRKCWHTTQMAQKHGFLIPKSLSEIRANKLRLETAKSAAIQVEATWGAKINPKVEVTE